jgi:hypothetical protein
LNNPPKEPGGYLSWIIAEIMVVSYCINPVVFKGGRVRLVWHQRGSEVRQIPITKELSEKYVAMIAELNAEPSSD